MDKPELLNSFTERVDQFEKLQSFISKAQEHSGKFASAVVEKVVADNQAKSLEVVSQIIPLMSDMEGVIADLGARRSEVQDASRESQFRLEELELRLAIGDLSEEDFNAEASEFKAMVGSSDSQIKEFDAERMRFQEALERWTTLGADAGVIAEGGAVASNSTDAPVPMPAAEDVSDDSSEGGAVHAAIAMGEAEPDVVIRSDHAEPIESFDMAPDLNDDADVVFDAGGDDGFEVDDLDLVDDDSDIGLDGAGAGSEDQDKPRRAVLLYQEGTAEEQIYPFTGEVMSLGRGRDNDVQVKNDSKVSRYHCKLYRRGPNFYIEDNKSANGTLVNGELITERRLFGGEEVIIGETFFRFRILD